MKSINDCTSKYPDVNKVPLSVCQECTLRKLSSNDDHQCACGNGRLKEAGYDL